MGVCCENVTKMRGGDVYEDSTLRKQSFLLYTELSLLEEALRLR